MRDYDFRPRAVRDVVSAQDWYERQRPDLGNRFFDSVLQAIREAREHPQRFPEVRRGVRGVGCVGFPYRVYYQVRSGRIIIRAVYHLSRDPARWDDPDRD
jgi:plasmid stabilization system protein ParE